jgi:hypothetical protein
MVFFLLLESNFYRSMGLGFIITDSSKVDGYLLMDEAHWMFMNK